jgi:hypothetical protein
MTEFTVDRRSLFKGSGALVVSFALPYGPAEAEIGGAVKPPLAPDQLDSWLAIKADGDVVAYFGKMDMGQGVDVAIAQIVAEELDVPLARVSVVMGDTALTVNQGGASGSTGVQKGGIALRNAAAEARRVLVGGPSRPARGDRWCRGCGRRPGAQGRLWRADRRAVFRPADEVERQARQRPYSRGAGEAQAPQRLQDRRSIAAALRCPGQSLWPARLCHRHQGAGHAARPNDPPAGRGCGAARGRRGLGPRHSGGTGRPGQGVSRCRRRA